jgi:hypothetical protein
MVDWTQVETQLTHLGMTAEEGYYLALFPPKALKGSPCRHIHVQGELDRGVVENNLASLPGHNLGYIPNWGGTRNTEIKYCRALFYEDDNESTGMEEKRGQWERAGLPHPSLQVWTGGKSVHNYWILTEPCDGNAFRSAQKLLFAQVKRTVPEADVDVKLCNPARVMRLAGGIHPETKEVSRVISATGERFPLEQLVALCSTGSQVAAGSGGAPMRDTTRAPRQGLLSAKARANLGHNLPQGEAPAQGVALPDRDIDPQAYQAFVASQEEYDRKHRPQGVHYAAMTFDDKVRTTTEALTYCPQRLEPGSGTYGHAFEVLAALVNEFGAEQSLAITVQAAWSQEHWDIEEQIQAIRRSSEDRQGVAHKRIYFLFDTAEYNGWPRTWPVLREVKRKDTSQDDELLKELKHYSFKQWSTSAANRLTLESVFHPKIAQLLGGRADAFPVAHTAMIAPFMTTTSAVLGKRYRVQIKPGWREPVVFWMGTVAPASSLKTPVANQFLGPLLNLDARDQREYKRELARHKAVPKEERDDAPPLPRQRVVIDATLEGLCTLLERENAYGVVSFHDELAAFIGDMDKYRSNNSDRAHWLSMWSGGAINIVRKGCDPIMVERTCVNVFGAIQQDKLTQLLHGDDAASKSGDGFWARFLWVVPEYVFPKQNLNDTEITQELTRLLHNLDQHISDREVVQLSGTAWELFAQVCDDWSQEADHTYSSRAAFLGKMRGYLARVAGLLHVLDYAIEEPDGPLDPEITREVMERAVVLCKYFICQFDVLAPQVGGGDLPAWVVKIVRFAEENGTGVVTHRDLVLKKWARNGDEARGMLSSLVDEYGVGRLVRQVRKDQVRWELGT